MLKNVFDRFRRSPNRKRSGKSTLKPHQVSQPVPKNRSSWVIRFLKHAVFYSLVLAILSGIGLSSYLIVLSKDLPDVTNLKDPDFKLPTLIFDRNGDQFYELYDEKRILLTKDNIPDVVKKALIAIEDTRFYSHAGIDLIRVVKAAIVNVRAGRIVEGASTITQQTAKLFFLTPEKNFRRKIMEALLALKIEKNFEKDEILELYLNKAFFGRHARGIEAAAKEFFSKSSRQLTVDEAALLVGLLKAPSSLSPVRNPEGALSRRNVVLGAMFRNGFISAEEFEIYSKKKLEISPGSSNYFPETEYYANEVRKLLASLGKTDVNTAGYKVYTFMDLKMQRFAEDALRNGLDHVQQRKGLSATFENVAAGNDIKTSVIDDLVAENVIEVGEIVKGVVTRVDDDYAEVQIGIDVIGHIQRADVEWALSGGEGLKSVVSFGDVGMFKLLNYDRIKKSFEVTFYQPPEANGGIISMDPATGEVYAVVGGYSFSDSQFNRAIQSNRQTGSAFKPILYATALERGYTLASILDDNPYESDGEEFVWRPENYGRNFSGFISFRDSLVYSKNVPTVRLLEDIGISPLLATIRKLGIDDSKFPRDYSIALGSASITPEEIAVAYSTFANGGYLVTPKYIKTIIDRSGKVIYDYRVKNPPEPEVQSTDEETAATGKQVFSPETAFLISSVLQDVIKRGTGRAAASIGRPAAGKTGTTNNYSDAWFVGYVPQLITSVYVGNDMPSIPLGENETGGKAALPIWLEFMKNATRTMPSENFKQPPRITTVKIDPDTGFLICSGAGSTNERFEYFKVGTEPSICAQENTFTSSVDTASVDATPLDEETRIKEEL